MYRFLVFLMLLILINPVFAEKTVVTQRSYYNPYYPPHTAYYGGDYIPKYHKHRGYTQSAFSDINDLEMYVFNKNFFRENDISRLERLELQALGAIQEGNINTRYENVRNTILSRPKQNFKTSLIRNLGNYFTGQMTGFTPQVNSSYNISPTMYGNSSSTSFSSPWSRGYRTNNYGISSGSGIHILD